MDPWVSREIDSLEYAASSLGRPEHPTGLEPIRGALAIAFLVECRRIGVPGPEQSIAPRCGDHPECAWDSLSRRSARGKEPPAADRDRQPADIAVLRLL